MNSKPTAVLLDNNIYADISENRNDAAKHLETIERAISKGIITIPASMEVLNEIALLAPSNRKEFEARWTLFYELVNWSFPLKFAADILSDDILSFARNGIQSTPFSSPKYPRHNVITSLATEDTPPTNDDLKDLIEGVSKSKTFFRT